MGPTKEITARRTRPKNNKEIDHFWNFTNQAGSNTAELVLYGEISAYSWYGDEITPNAFDTELKALGNVQEIVVRINSGGGDVFAAMAIYSRLMDHSAKIIVKIDGWCASAATLIACAADEVQIAKSGLYMIHDPKAGIVGYFTAEELIKYADELEKIKQQIRNVYMKKTCKPEDELREIMAKEEWLTGEEAIEQGFCDTLMFEDVEIEVENYNMVVVNNVGISLENFRTVPKRLLSPKDTTIETPQNKVKEETVMTEQEMREKHPDVVKAIEAAAIQNHKTQSGAGTGTDNGTGTDTVTDNTGVDAVNAERQRIKAIDEITLPGFENLANDAKYTNPISAEAFAMKIVAEQKKTGANYLNNRNADVQDSGISGVQGEHNDGTQDTDPFGEIIDGMFPKTK